MRKEIEKNIRVIEDGPFTIIRCEINGKKYAIALEDKKPTEEDYKEFIEIVFNSLTSKGEKQ